LEFALTGDPLLIAILGPTASGKTALSLELAERFQGEIVNCDSVAMYREFEIGTAKPSAKERARVPHHLFDLVAPDSYMTAGEYARQGRQILNDIKARGHLPIVVGGTGLYLRALLEGLFPGPQRSEELRARLRDAVERRGAVSLHRILRRLDAEAAGKIHANDTPKLIRAIEVCVAARRQMTEMWRQGREPLTGFRILPVVARVIPNYELRINASEVADAFEVPLAFLMAEENHALHSREWKGMTRTVYAMPFGERNIWGVTAGILRNLYERVYCG